MLMRAIDCATAFRVSCRVHHHRPPVVRSATLWSGPLARLLGGYRRPLSHCRAGRMELVPALLHCESVRPSQTLSIHRTLLDRACCSVATPCQKRSRLLSRAPECGPMAHDLKQKVGMNLSRVFKGSQVPPSCERRQGPRLLETIMDFHPGRRHLGRLRHGFW